MLTFSLSIRNVSQTITWRRRVSRQDKRSEVWSYLFFYANPTCPYTHWLPMTHVHPGRTHNDGLKAFIQWALMRAHITSERTVLSCYRSSIGGVFIWIQRRFPAGRAVHQKQRVKWTNSSISQWDIWYCDSLKMDASHVAFKQTETF